MNNYNQFPPVFIAETEKKKAEALQKIETDARGYNQSVSKKKISGNLNGKGFFIVAGIGALIAIINLFAAFSNCNAMFCDMTSESERAADRFFSGLGTSVIILLIGAAAGGVAEIIVRCLSSAKDKSCENQIQVNNDSIPLQKQSTIQYYDNQINEYSTGFEQEAKRKSVNYAETDLAKNVIVWMTKGFCRTIESADRRPHIQQIDVPFRFDVYYNKITCNLGTYDFELERCSNLTSVMNQAALSRAIASAIQLNVTMEYQNDISGGSFDVDISYSYTNESAVATIRYLAYNANYQPTRSWEEN